MVDAIDSNNSFTRGIASFVSGLRYDAIPEEVRARIKLLILDSLGCGLYGCTKQHSQILLNSLRSLDTTRECGVWGTAQRLSAPHAVLANGAFVQGFELDDTHFFGILHVGCVTLPPIMAIAEMRPGMTGRAFLTAAVAGYEIGPRVGLCMGNEHVGQGWHGPATVGVFSAAAGAAAALGLSEEQTINAIGIAGTQSAGLMAAQYGAMVKPMNGGRAAQSGFYAAYLAEKGFTGIRNVFEREYGGFCTTFSRSTDRFTLGRLTAGLGERFETMRDSLKFYSCAASNHTPLDAMRLMRQRRPFSPVDVERICVYGSRFTVDHVGFRYVPNGLTGAQMNLPFCMATLLLEGEVFVDQFTDEAITDPRRMALAEKVAVVHDPAITALGPEFRQKVRVEVLFKDGSTIEETLAVARGRESNFASEADIVRKFGKLAVHVLPQRKLDRIIETVLKLEQVQEVSVLATLLTDD